MHFLTPVLPNDPEYDSPQTVHHSCFPSQSDVQGLSGSGPLSAVPLHGSLTWLYSNVIRSVMRRWDVFVLSRWQAFAHIRFTHLLRCCVCITHYVPVPDTQRCCSCLWQMQPFLKAPGSSPLQLMWGMARERLRWWHPMSFGSLVSQRNTWLT